MRTRRTVAQEQIRYGWISTGVAAERIGVTSEHVVALCDAGELVWRDVSLPAARRREIRVDPASVDRWLDERTRGAA